MQSRISLLVALLVVAGANPLLAQRRVPASVWRQTVGQERLRFDEGDSDRDRGGYYSDGYYSDADSDSDSDSDSDGGRSNRDVRSAGRLPSDRFPSDRYPSDRDARSTQGGVGTVLRDVILGRSGGGGIDGTAGRVRTGGVGGVLGGTNRDGIGGTIGRARDAGQVRSRGQLPAANRSRAGGGIGAVLDDVVRARAGENTGEMLSRVIGGLLLGGR